MILDEVADELYAAEPEDFVALRTTRASAARKAGDRTLAQQIGALRKPTRSAWLVNLLAGEEPEELAALLDLGEALAQAQRSAKGAELRTLSTQRSAAVAGLVRRASSLGADHRHEVSEATRREVEQTLTAALSDPELAQTVRAGRVTVAVSYGGFGPDLVLGQAPEGSAAVNPTPTRRRVPAAEREATLAAQAEAALQRLDAARTGQQQAATAADQARADLASAEQAVAVARRELAEREAVLAQAQALDERARDELEHSRAETRDAEQAATRAASELRRSGG